MNSGLAAILPPERFCDVCDEASARSRQTGPAPPCIKRTSQRLVMRQIHANLMNVHLVLFDNPLEFGPRPAAGIAERHLYAAQSVNLSLDSSLDRQEQQARSTGPP